MTLLEDWEHLEESLPHDNLVFWLYHSQSLPMDHFISFCVGHITTDTWFFSLSDVVHRLIDAKTPGIERLMPESLPYLGRQLNSDPGIISEDILGMTFMIAWLFPAEIATWEDLPAIANLIWGFLNDADEPDREDVDFYLLTGILAAFLVIHVTPIGVDELTKWARDCAMEADPNVHSTKFFGALSILTISCLHEPARLAGTFWIAEKLAIITSQVPSPAMGCTMVGTCFLTLLAQACPERQLEIIELMTQLIAWQSREANPEEQSFHLNWSPPILKAIESVQQARESA
jgi:hypothetical protein